ncbi:MAG TPA: S-methyl-5-thioribose-1-phosphate isomerase [Candidatus Acidoferrales bacterium]|nr:S-methyl-5-thioribose-1-phosphate isomerase [Candidatus Acidoferrales bacterium]
MVHRDILKVVDDIRIRQMRGGTVVTHAALNALRSAAVKTNATSSKEFLGELAENVKYLMKIRAASIPLSNSLRIVSLDVKQAASRGAYVKELQNVLSKSATQFDTKLEESIREIAEIGARRIKVGDVVMTHSYSSSVIAILKRAHQQRKRLKIFVTETRPELEGRDVARELAAEGIDVTLIIDSAASHFIEDSDKVLIGAEAVAANGAIVNKIGTATIASVAQRARVRVYAAASTYKFSPETMLGELIDIEERDPSNVLGQSKLKKMPHFSVRNPAFDVTSPQDIDLIITERGVIPPQAAIMIVREQKGVSLP